MSSADIFAQRGRWKFSTIIIAYLELICDVQEKCVKQARIVKLKNGCLKQVPAEYRRISTSSPLMGSEIVVF